MSETICATREHFLVQYGRGKCQSKGTNRTDLGFGPTQIARNSYFVITALDGLNYRC